MKIKFLISLLFFMFNQNIYALPGEPVYDHSNWVVAGEQLTTLKAQIEALDLQLTELENQYLAITGSNSFNGSFDNDDFWQLIEDMDSLREMIRTNGANTDDKTLKESINFYDEIYGSVSEAEDFFPEKPHAYSANSLEGHSAATREGLIMSKTIVERVNEMSNKLREYQDKNYTLNTQKEAIDFGNNLQIELLHSMNELIRMQALQYSLLSESENIETQNNEFNRKFFNTDFYKEGGE